MPVSVCVQCNGRPVTAALSLTRKESFISSSLKRNLGLDGMKHCLFFEDELKKGLFSAETHVFLTVSSGTKQIVIAAAVADIERDLILETPPPRRRRRVQLLSSPSSSESSAWESAHSAEESVSLDRVGAGTIACSLPQPFLVTLR